VLWDSSSALALQVSIIENDITASPSNRQTLTGFYDYLVVGREPDHEVGEVAAGSIKLATDYHHGRRRRGGVHIGSVPGRRFTMVMSGKIATRFARAGFIRYCGK